MRPKDLLFLSAFDFSLYLTTDRCRTLRNEAANYQEITEQTNHSLAEPPNRPKSDLFEYEVIQSPQKFILNFSVDWRIVSLDFWSQCYCRYEPKPSVSIKEQEIVSEIERLRERKRQVVTKSRRSCTFDPLHPVRQSSSFFSNKIQFDFVFTDFSRKFVASGLDGYSILTVHLNFIYFP